MTKINDYLWYLPHMPEIGDPPDIGMLQQTFNSPIVEALKVPLSELGYELKSSDVMVRLDDRLDRTADTFYANVRFIRYLTPDVITRVHFEHLEWAHFLATSGDHRYVINLDRFKLLDPENQIAERQWEGRLHTRMSSRPDVHILEHAGQDQIWVYQQVADLDQQLALFRDKFRERGMAWLEDRRTMGVE